MLNLQAWVDRVSTDQIAAGLASTVDAASQLRTLPSMLVLPGREIVENQALVGGPGARHKVVTEVLVMTAVPRGNRSLGGDARDELNALRKPMLMSLINWQPEDVDVGITWQEGRLVSLSSNALVWTDRFRTEYWWSL